MGIILTGAVARHERRVRVLFDRPLAAPALTNAALYAVTASDGTAVPISGLVLLLGEPSAVDLALGADLLPGAAYAVRADGVPAQDGTTAPAGSVAPVQLGAPSSTSNAEVQPTDIDALLYGVDLVWTGDDYGETSAGDLATTSGSANVEAALERRLVSEGLPWDDTYGAKPRAYVDGAPGALPSLRGALIREARADDRVKAATCSYAVGDDSSSASFDVKADLIGQGDAVSVTVNPNAGV
jgi:hypothetical protein